MGNSVFTPAMQGNTDLVIKNVNLLSGSPYQMLAAKGALFAASWRGHSATVRALCEWGVNVDSQCEAGDTPLMWAARWGHKDVIEVLLFHGANKDIKDNIGNRAFDYAKNNNNLIVLYLLN